MAGEQTEGRMMMMMVMMTLFFILVGSILLFVRGSSGILFELWASGMHMCMCMCMCTSMHGWLGQHALLNLKVGNAWMLCMFTCMYVNVHVSKYGCMHILVYECVNVWMCKYMVVCMFEYMNVDIVLCLYAGSKLKSQIGRLKAQQNG